jgi:predicted Zn-dependent peptidase
MSMTVSVKVIIFLILAVFLTKASAFKPDMSQCRLLTKQQIQQLMALRPIHDFQMENGLRVYLMQNHEAPLFTLRLLVDVGAADENEQQQGYAHLFEHMMFKGSKHVPDKAHFAVIKTVGGQLNAMTDYDKTAYWTEAPLQHLDRALWLEAERLKYLSINSATLENQKQAVLEEKLLTLDNVPYFKTVSEFMLEAWQGTPYDHLVIGTEQSISDATVEQVEEFFRQYYHPANMIMTLVGDFDALEAKTRIEHYFSHPDWTLQEKPALSAKKHQNKLLRSARMDTRTDILAPFPLYAIGWHTVGIHDSDYYAVELLSDILLNHEASRFKRLLKSEQQLVFDLLGFPLIFEQLGITAMGMAPHSYARFSQIKAQLLSMLEEIHERGVTREELCAAKKFRQIKALQALDDNRQLAALIGDGVLFHNDPWHFLSALEHYAAIDNQQIKLVARRYFNNDWLALEIIPAGPIRFIKWLLEVLPKGLAQNLEYQAL